MDAIPKAHDGGCRHHRCAGQGDRWAGEYHGRSRRTEHEQGTYGGLEDAMPFGEVNGMFKV